MTKLPVNIELLANLFKSCRHSGMIAETLELVYHNSKAVDEVVTIAIDTFHDGCLGLTVKEKEGGDSFQLGVHVSSITVRPLAAHWRQSPALKRLVEYCEAEKEAFTVTHLPILRSIHDAGDPGDMGPTVTGILLEDNLKTNLQMDKFLPVILGIKGAANDV